MIREDSFESARSAAIVEDGGASWVPVALCSGRKRCLKQVYTRHVGQ
jgi:hypothetical protein